VTRGAARIAPVLLALLAAGCTHTGGAGSGAESGAGSEAARTRALQRQVQSIVVIYAENRSFDNLYGRFRGARGLDEVLDAQGRPLAAYAPQRDRDGTLLATLPPTWGGVTAAGVTPVVTQAQSSGLPNAPFAIETAFTARSGATLSTFTVTRDLYHRFYEHQMQIADGRNDGFAAWSDAGGLTMGHYDYSHSAMADIARQYTLADEFFQGAFGGSFLNHQYLICACAPVYPHADAPPTGAHPSITLLDRDVHGKYLPRLTPSPSSPASALDGPPLFAASGNIAPFDYFGDGTYHAVNTMQPAYQPSANAPSGTEGSDLLYAAPGQATTLPPQTQPTIGDLLDAARVDWKWYAGAWNAALADGARAPGAKRKVIYAPSGARAEPDFQTHHAPFNYYAAMDPVAHAAYRAAHLKDYADLLADAAAGTLPPVAFYKPQGNLNQHEGYANLDDGDAHLAGLVARLQSSPQWPHMLIIVTYDEFGGVWDHVPPPRGDLLGPGTRIPAIVVSPFARRGFVDHTPYDTGSILRLIARRFDLPKLAGVRMRDEAIAAHGEAPLGDLTGALDLD